MTQKISPAVFASTAWMASTMRRLSARRLARAFHSSASTDTAWMMSSTPRPMPPAKSLTRNRGMMEFSMMSFETASVT
jgi:hypothetical protein